MWQAAARSQITHTVNLQEPYPRFRHGTDRPVQQRQHQQEQRRRPQSRLSSIRTREPRHLGQEEENANNCTAFATTHD